MVSFSKSKVFTKITNIILDILIFIFGIILLISLYNMVQVRILGNDYSSFFGYTVFEVQTGSMKPEINAGDWIVVKEENDYNPNDIITFKEEDNFITHRVIEKYSDNFVTKGDANSSEDDPITKDQIVGEVTNVIPFFGFFKATIFNPYILLLLIVILYIINFNAKKKGGNRVFDKVKKIILEIKSSLFKKKTKDDTSFFDDDNEKSIENIGSTPKFSEYEEKVESYNNNSLEFETDDEDLSEPKIELETDEDVFEKTEEEIKEEDLSKTMFFRIISVDDDTEENGNIKLEEQKLTEEPDEEITKEIQEELVEEEIEEKGQLEAMMDESNEEPEETGNSDEDDEHKLKLEMIFNKPEHKRSKNIIARGMAIKEEELSMVIDKILGDNKLQVNEASIKKLMIKSYIESKYFNIFSENVAKQEGKKTTNKKEFVLDNKLDVITESNGFSKNHKVRVRKILTRVALALEEDASSYAKKYTGNDKKYNDKLKKYATLLMIVAKLEYLVDINKDMKSKKMLYAKEIIKFITEHDLEHDSIETVCKDVIHVQKEHRSASKYFLDKLNTEVFEIKYGQLKTDKNKFVLNLKHNINFSQVYSDLVVDKAYQEGVVAEDKLNVLLTLLQARLVSDMLVGDFINEYIVSVPSSLVQKESKFERLLKQNNEEYAKKNIIYLIEYDQFMKKNSMIKTLRKAGYRISIYINENTNFVSKNKLYIAITENIFIDKNVKGIVDLEKVVFSNFKDKIIKDDISSKLIVVEDDK